MRDPMALFAWRSLDLLMLLFGAGHCSTGKLTSFRLMQWQTSQYRLAAGPMFTHFEQPKAVANEVTILAAPCAW